MADSGGEGAAWGSQTSVPGYTLLRGIDVDRSGALVSGIDDTSGRRVLVRILSPALRENAGYMRRLRADVAVVCRIRHPHLVTTLGFDRRAGGIVYEGVEAVSLRRILAQQGPLQAVAAFVMLEDCLQALAALHAAQLTHRDIRSEAVLVDERGVVVLRDACVPVPGLRAGWQPGTPEYTAPELWQGQPASPASDIYALTCVFVEALTARVAFPSADLEALRRRHAEGDFDSAALPPKIRPLVARGLSVDPEQRPREAAGFRSDLAITAAACAGGEWADEGRAELARIVQRMGRSSAAPPAPPALAVEEEEAVAAAPVRAAWWRSSRAWLAAALALAALVVLVVVVAAAESRGADTGTGSPATPTTPVAPSAPSGLPFSPAPTGLPGSSQATPPTAAPTQPPAVTPNTAQPSIAPAVTPTAARTPTPAPSPSATPCLVTPPVPVCPSPRS